MGMPQQGVMERQAKASIKWLKQQEDSVVGSSSDGSSNNSLVGNTGNNSTGSSGLGLSSSSGVSLGTAAHVPSSLLPSPSLARSSGGSGVGIIISSSSGSSNSVSMSGGNGLLSPFGARIRPRGLVSEVGKSTTPAKTPNHRKPLVISRRSTPRAALTNGEDGVHLVTDGPESSTANRIEGMGDISSPLPKLDLSSPNAKQGNKLLQLRMDPHSGEDEKQDSNSSSTAASSSSSSSSAMRKPIAIKSPNQETGFMGPSNSDAPRLSNPHYATSPPISELKTWPTSQLRRVKGFTITKYHPLTGEAVGSICWDGETDISNVDLERDVVIVNEVIK
jgi:hypothetical protein